MNLTLGVSSVIGPVQAGDVAALRRAKGVGFDRKGAD